MCSICRRWAFLAVSRRARASSSWVFTPKDSLYSRENWDCRHLYSRVSFTTSSGIFRKSIWKFRRLQWRVSIWSLLPCYTGTDLNNDSTQEYEMGSWIPGVVLPKLPTARNYIFTLSFSLSLTASWSSTCSFSNSAMRLLANSWLCSNSAFRLSN